MAIHWRLKSYVASQHGIYSGTRLRRRIAEKTGILISLQNICNYLNGKPKVLRLTTIELICTALGCELKDFCEIKGWTESQQASARTDAPKKLSFKNTPLAKRAGKTFPDPRNY